MELTSQTLIEAANRFIVRTDQFAAGKAEICADLAAKRDATQSVTGPLFAHAVVCLDLVHS